MEDKEKIIVKRKLGLTVQEVLAINKKSNNKIKVGSLRKLAASSGVEYSIIQKISTGQKDPQFTTIISLIDGLGLTPNEFFFLYDKIQDTPIIQKKKSLHKRSKLSKK